MEMPVASVTSTCVPAELAGRELLPYEAAGRLARAFQLLGHDTRLRLLHAFGPGG
jgi:hypothetical protein